jgi:CheY-like chemotaxis protein
VSIMSVTLRRDLLAGWPVLVVEDEPDSLEVAERILRFYGATVHTATNGKEGLEAARRLLPRFILSDLSMPEMDGWEMLFELKQDRATLDIPVIALTAHAMKGDRERAITAGFHNYLTKPLNPATFMSDVVKLLDNVPELAGALRAS